jgi:hypothetical protein
MIARTETSPTVLRLGAAAAYASAVVAPIGLAFLVAMYVAFAAGAESQGLVFGGINDVLAVVTGLLMLPIAVAVHVLLRDRAPRRWQPDVRTWAWSPRRTSATRSGPSGWPGISSDGPRSESSRPASLSADLSS